MRHVAAVTDIRPIPVGTRLVHIGLAKTGTTALQSSLHNCRAVLAEHGVEYAGTRRHSRTAATAITYDKLPTGFPADAAKRWARLARSVRNSQADRVILSSEVLAGITPSRAQRLVSDLGGSVQIVLTTRPLANIVASRWQQRVQEGQTRTYADWLHELFGIDRSGPGNASFWRRFDLAGQIGRWGPIIGEENITIVVLDPRDRSMLLHSFEGLLGLPTGSLVPDSSLTNPSLGYREISALSAFNRAFTASGRTHEEFLHALRGKALTDLKTDPARPPSMRIATPRWAAEAANEAVRPWIAALRASEARVIGDPEHLLVDPEDFEEAPRAPTEIDTESAGEIAFLMYEAGLKYGEKRGLRAARRGGGASPPGEPPDERPHRLRRAASKVIGALPDAVATRLESARGQFDR
jgi:hypothetical protein